MLQINGPLLSNMLRRDIDAIKEKTDPRQTLDEAIRDIASQCSDCAHAAIRISPTAECRLNSKSTNTNYASFVTEMLLGMPRGMAISHLQLVGDRINLRRQAPTAAIKGVKPGWVSAIAENLIQAILFNEGNCWEKAMLAGVFFNATYQSALRQKGFAEVDIDRAHINVEIAGNLHVPGGDHCVCIITHNIDHGCLMVDPWMNGSVGDRQNLEKICEENIGIGAVQSFRFKPQDFETCAVGDEDCVAKVMEFAKEVLGGEPKFADLFAYYDRDSRQKETAREKNVYFFSDNTELNS